MTQKPTLHEVIQRRLDKRMASFAVSLPGTVVSYDPETETAVVRPGVHRLVPSLVNPDLDLVEELPQLVNVPVAWPRAQGFSLVGSLGAGDPVTLIAFDRDASGWRRTGAPSAPDDARGHVWASAVALPGLQADVGGFPVPGDAAALANRVEEELSALRTKLNALVAAFNFHTHAVSGAATVAPTANANPLIPAQTADAVGDVGSTILLLDE